MEPNKKRGIYISAWAFVIAAIIAIIVILYMRRDPDAKIDVLQQTKNNIETRIDSLHNQTTETRANVVKNAETRAQTSANILKSIPKNEKIIIRDTAYTSMCNYVATYRAE